MHAWGSRAVRALAVAWVTVFAGPAWAQIDPGSSEISEQDLMNAFQQNGLRSSTTLVDYTNFQSDLGGSISNTITQSNLIDSLDSGGGGLFDLTKSYVQQELNQVDGGQVQSALPDGLPDLPGSTPKPQKTAPPAPAPCPTCVRLSRELADLRGKLVALELRLAFSWFSSSQTKAKLRTEIAQAKTKIAATEAALKTARAAAQQAWLAEEPSWGRTSLRPTRSRRAMLPDDMPMLFGEGKRPAAGSAFRLGKAQLIELAQQPDGSNPLGALMDDTWNLWA